MMPFAITQLPGEPILIVRIEVPVDQNLTSVMSVFDQLAQLARASASPLYILIDLRGQALAFSDILITMQLLSRPDSWIEQRSARPILVGSDPMFGIAIKRLRNLFGVDILRFDTLKAALAYARTATGSRDKP